MCAIFGLIDYGKRFSATQRERILSVLSRECEQRGTDATGFAFNKKAGLTIYKRPLKASEMRLKLPDEANIILGHTRMTTQGAAAFNANNHPFRGRVSGEDFALAHNGILRNDWSLKREENLPKTEIETDSYVAVQLLEKQSELSLESVASMAEKIDGSFVFTILDRHNNSYFIRGDNPLALYHCEKFGFYIYASTEKILKSALEKLGLQKIKFTEIKTACGDVLKISANGSVEQTVFDTYLLDRNNFRYYYPWWEDFDVDYNLPYIKQLKDFASSLGVGGDEIELLLDYGYSTDEIEDLLYAPGGLESALALIFDEYDYCEEW